MPIVVPYRGIGVCMRCVVEQVEDSCDWRGIGWADLSGDDVPDR